ncbi:MAG: extracellular solute-binding protein [Spirochaetes bacterium]|jgi:raffinose/stachyose/melibiose transport system substrate-binding protein|nr:extracellular solute-binding protein [Spirochaetota bacterium]
MERRKLILSLVLMVAVAALGFAGGQSEEGAGSGGEASAEPEMVELDIFQSKTVIADQFEALGEEFEAANPNVTVNVETVGGSADWQTILKSRFTADEGPDVYNIEGASDYQLWQENIADLSGEPFTDQAVPSAVEPMTFDGNVYAAPLNFEGYGYIYNQDMFEDAGIEEAPTTFSELEAAAQQLEEAGYTAFSTGYGTWWVIGFHLLNAAFAQQDDPDQFMEDLTNGEASMAENAIFQDLQQLVDLTVEYGEDNPLATDHNQQTQMLANEEVAMIQQGIWKEPSLLEANPDLNLGVIPILINDDSQMDRIAVGVPWYFVVNAQASEAEQEAGKAFINFMMTSDTGLRYTVEEFGHIPAYQGASAEGLGGVGQGILAYTDQNKTIPWTMGQWPDGFDQQDAFNNMQAYVDGRQTWNETLQALDEAWRDRSE